MQKKNNHKNNLKHLGMDDSIRAKDPKGITLIALIITILFSYDEK